MSDVNTEEVLAKAENLVLKERLAALDQRVTDLTDAAADREDAVREAVAADRKHTLALVKMLVAPPAPAATLEKRTDWEGLLTALTKALPIVLPLLEGLLSGAKRNRDGDEEEEEEEQGPPVVLPTPEGADSFVVVQEDRIRGVVDVAVTAAGLGARFGAGTFDLLACDRNGALLNGKSAKVTIEAAS